MGYSESAKSSSECSKSPSQYPIPKFCCAKAHVSKNTPDFFKQETFSTLSCPINKALKKGGKVMELQAVKKKAYKNVFILIFIWLLFFVSVIGYGIYWLFFDWSRFKDELINSSTSPNGIYTINAYLSNSGATVSYTVLGELVFNKENKRPKKIYWQYQEEFATIEWIDDNTVIINDVTLDLPKETYDYRRGIK